MSPNGFNNTGQLAYVIPCRTVQNFSKAIANRLERFLPGLVLRIKVFFVLNHLIPSKVHVVFEVFYHIKKKNK